MADDLLDLVMLVPGAGDALGEPLPNPNEWTWQDGTTHTWQDGSDAEWQPE